MSQSSLPYTLAHKAGQTWSDCSFAQFSEPEIYTINTENTGVVYNTRYTCATYYGNGSLVPVKMADGLTLAAMTPIKNDGTGVGVAALAGEAYVGYLRNAISATSNDYAEVIVDPGNLI